MSIHKLTATQRRNAQSVLNLFTRQQTYIAPKATTDAMTHSTSYYHVNGKMQVIGFSVFMTVSLVYLLHTSGLQTVRQKIVPEKNTELVLLSLDFCFRFWPCENNFWQRATVTVGGK